MPGADSVRLGFRPKYRSNLVADDRAILARMNASAAGPLLRLTTTTGDKAEGTERSSS